LHYAGVLNHIFSIVRAVSSERDWDFVGAAIDIRLITVRGRIRNLDSHSEISLDRQFSMALLKD
jgi:hypothetical protein